jgi:catechol 2,3-dioxygenase-like lactoylglutathione lyase family enzyme
VWSVESLPGHREKRMDRPTIRHIAIFVRDVDKVAQFYQSVFQMDLIKKTEATATEGKAYFLSDGYLTLAVLPQRLAGEVAHGINHFGFTVEDTGEISRRIVEFGVEEPKKRPSTRPFAEHRGCDPEGILFDLSEQGFGRAEIADGAKKKIMAET